MSGVGKLKLKGVSSTKAPRDKKIKKHKKEKKRDHSDDEKDKTQSKKRQRDDFDHDREPSEPKKTKLDTEDTEDTESDPYAWMTPAQKQFELVQQQRLAQRIEKKTELSHQEKVTKFNQYLEKQTDIMDIPKVGPG